MGYISSCSGISGTQVKRHQKANGVFKGVFHAVTCNTTKIKLATNNWTWLKCTFDFDVKHVFLSCTPPDQNADQKKTSNEL